MHENSSFDYVATITQSQYEASGTFEFHFLSNVVKSATDIKVSSELFEEHELLSFTNPEVTTLSLTFRYTYSTWGGSTTSYVPYGASIQVRVGNSTVATLEIDNSTGRAMLDLEDLAGYDDDTQITFRYSNRYTTTTTVGALRNGTATEFTLRN